MRSNLPINKIAKMAGVSPATVSRVINHRELVRPETTRKVVQAMEQMELALPVPIWESPGETNKKVIVINTVRDGNPFYTEIYHGIETSAASHGYELIWTSNSFRKQDISSYVELMKRIGISGLITLNRIGKEELLTLDHHFPLIQCSEYNTESHIPYVGIDDQGAAKQAVNFLILAGRNKIAFVNGPSKYRYAKQRQEGFLEAMREADLHVPKNWILHIPDINYDMAYASVSQLLRNDPVPNAIFAVSDVLALAAVNAARRYRLQVPKDVMVIGFDDIPLCKMVRPAITTISQPAFQLGFTACENLVSQIEQTGMATSSTVLATELIIRGTARMM